MAIIDIGTKKQLFLDDYLIESMTNVKQGLNPAVKPHYNPILRPERPWEGTIMRPSKVVFDEGDQVFKMWYSSGTSRIRLDENGQPVRGGAAGYVSDSLGNVNCLATSQDGVRWERPSLGLVEFDGSKDNNILPDEENLPTSPAFQDLHESDPAKRYKALIGSHDVKIPMKKSLFYSPDGIEWTAYENNPVLDYTPELGRWGPHHHMGWDPIRETYAAYHETSVHWLGPYGKRIIARAESPDMINWTEPEIVLVPDEEDYPDTEFYNMPVMAYEGIYIAMLWIFRTTNITHHPEVAFSRDGFHFERNYREPFIFRGAALEDFDSSSVYVQDVVVHGDRIFAYYQGTNSRSPEIAFKLGDKATTGIGLAVARLDGFVSLDSGKGWVTRDSNEEDQRSRPGERIIFTGPESFSQMVTRPFSFSGSQLQVNASMAAIAGGPGPGELRVEVLRANHKKLPGFKFEDADPITTPGVDQVVSWNGNSDLSQLAGKSIKLRFYFKNTKLYSFQFR